MKATHWIIVKQWTHWPRFKNLMTVMFGAWLVFFFVTNAFIKTLNKIVVPVVEIPLGFYIPMQAAMIVFVVTLFWLAHVSRD
jgi:putative solute:sodium symporter small subunit